MSARVFATVVPVGSLSRDTGPTSAWSPGREVRVVGRAELRGAPDRARLSVAVRSGTKSEAASAQRSAGRRAEYVESRVRQARGVKAEDVTVLQSLDRVDGLYVMTVEIVTEFSDFQAMHAVRNQLVEKLDSCVDVRSPVYHLTAPARDNYRRQACLLAVASARRKADEVCRLLGLALGRPLSVHELPSSSSSSSAAATQDCDWSFPAISCAHHEPGLASSNNQNSAVSSLREHVDAAAETVRCSVAAVFELRPKSGVKKRR